MNTIVTSQIAKLLEEKGFDEPCYDAYNSRGNRYSDGWCEYIDVGTPFTKSDLKGKYTLAPTIGSVVMWLYEKHGVWITVCVIGADGFGYWLHDKDRKRLNSDNQGGYWLLPTKAYEAAIKYCLTKLI